MIFRMREDCFRRPLSFRYWMRNLKQDNGDREKAGDNGHYDGN